MTGNVSGRSFVDLKANFTLPCEILSDCFLKIDMISGSKYLKQ